MHYAADSKIWAPFLGGISAGELEVSPDGQWVTYTTFPEFLWRSKLDGSERLQLTFAPINAHEPGRRTENRFSSPISRTRFLSFQRMVALHGNLCPKTTQIPWCRSMAARWKVHYFWKLCEMSRC